MRFLPNVLLVLSLPAGVIGFALGTRLVGAMSLPASLQGIALLFVPLFIAGLCMVPFIIPFIDRKAKADLAAHRQAVEAEQAATDSAKQ